MKVTVLVDNEYLIMPAAFDALLKKLARQERAVQVGVVMSMTAPSSIRFRLREWKRKLIFIGGVSGVWRYAKLYMVHLASRFGSVTTICKRHGVPFFVTYDINGAKAMKSLSAFRPDIIFSWQGQILSDEILCLPRLDCINKHASLLPDYRGVWPVFWMLLHGETQCGISLHRMTSRIDVGEILMQVAIEILPDDTVFSIYKRLLELLPDMVSDLIGKYENGDIERESVLPGEVGKYFGYPTWNDVKMLRNEVGREIL